ncbi:hypothetical protein IW261DRAFT_1566010 [Armillaria novae-zelandiae]|uniref:Uncharacterized protein n=1 Tax=Armillaria novae-zelandiae TaxID=153914 RepID=A0AA39P4X4_9AGAR|nr:hypothetical protein IW261DRAFT_1566010 [Armillaria novae-zelandiae]
MTRQKYEMSWKKVANGECDGVEILKPTPHNIKNRRDVIQLDESKSTTKLLSLVRYKTYYQDKDDVLTPVPAPASQISSDLVALLGDDIQSSSPEPDDAHHILHLPDTTVAPHRPGPDLSEPDDPTLWVMQPELMEDHLVTLGVYGSLPSLGSLIEVFKFDHYGCFVNLACAPPSVLSLEGKLLHVSGSTAMCMTVSLVTECMLFEPGHQGGYASASGTQGGKCVKHLKIMPFHQMFCHESTTWALAFDLKIPLGMVTEIPNVCFNFDLVLELISTFIVDSSACSLPAKGQWRSLAKKTLSAETVSPGSGYPTSMGFMDEVPIYDGHASAGTQFLFWPSDFAVIKSLPRFTTSHDLDAFALVTVGYSLSVWTSFNNEPCISPNILFTIVLGTTPKKEKLAELGFLD